MNTAILNQELNLTNAEANEFDALALVGEALEIKAQIEALTARDKAIRGELADLIGLGSTKIGDYNVSVTIPNRWTTEGKTRFVEDYPIENYPHLYKTPEPNTGAADKIQSIDTNQYKSLGTITVTIR